MPLRLRKLVKNRPGHGTLVDLVGAVEQARLLDFQFRLRGPFLDDTLLRQRLSECYA